MPKYNPGMAEDDLDIPTSDMPEGDTEMGDESEEESTDNADGEETTTIPKSMFQGKSVKPNDQFYFTVVAVHGDEVEVKYSTGEDESGSEMSKSQSSMDKLPRY